MGPIYFLINFQEILHRYLGRIDISYTFANISVLVSVVELFDYWPLRMSVYVFVNNLLMSTLASPQTLSKPPAYEKSVFQIQICVPSTSSSETSSPSICFPLTISLRQWVTSTCQEGQQWFCQSITKQGLIFQLTEWSGYLNMCWFITWAFDHFILSYD